MVRSVHGFAAAAGAALAARLGCSDHPPTARHLSMYRNTVAPIAAFALLAAAGCQPRAAGPELSPDPRVNTFIAVIEKSLETHDWAALAELADSAHYHAQVVEHGMAEAQYVAELFGLHDVDNSIKRGETVTWSDLERIEDVTLHEIDRAAERLVVRGHVRLAGGEVLDLRAWVVDRDGRLRLTSGFG